MCDMQKEEKKELYDYLLYLGDNALILGQRLSEWCGHGPVLEQDIAITNIALDLIGQSRLYYQYAAELAGAPVTEDSLAFLRDEASYRNLLLVEQPNGDWAHTIVRQFLFDSYHYALLRGLEGSADEKLAAIAAKSIKEVAYHLRYSSEWMQRLGDGTAESHRRMQVAVDDLWMYAGECLAAAEFESWLAERGIAPDPGSFRASVESRRGEVLQRSTLTAPDIPVYQEGGKRGVHTEHLGYILTELQYMQRVYPGMEW